ncbi:hypothetical protein [Streptomyces sp. H39-C1]|uniref:hypothetical protein n=1 Tax=Streptomyces sp. H39-C1 TaxID=3004355 RepID=UPI0022AF4CE9|nr:hypothetical protein [Streptomyces sp. H39-C1]MCZ4101089.1 hypothetical protein [Streptomyces sp. H39-C1]
MTTRTAQDKAARAKRDQHASATGDAAAAALKAALARLDLALPSLHSGMPVDGTGYVTLGGCSASLASRLAEVINLAADALQAPGR